VRYLTSIDGLLENEREKDGMWEEKRRRVRMLELMEWWFAPPQTE